jgi:hypothetical protein
VTGTVREVKRQVKNACSGLKQCSGSVTFWYGCRCGSISSDLDLLLMDPDPDPALFVTDLHDCKKKNSQTFYADSFLKVHLHHSSKIKSHKKLQNSRNQGSLIFFLLIQIRIRTSKLQIQEAQKHTDPTYPDTVWNTGFK